MPEKYLKRLLISFGAIVVLLLIAGLTIESKFRPREEASITVPSDVGYLEGKLSEPTGWIPFALPGIAGADVSLAPGDHRSTTDGDGKFAIPDILPVSIR